MPFHRRRGLAEIELRASQQYRHPGEGRDLTIASLFIVEIPAFAGMRI
jgi:hypothetical protein